MSWHGPRLPDSIFREMSSIKDVHSRKQLLRERYRIPDAIARAIGQLEPRNHEDLLRIPEVVRGDRKTMLRLIQAKGYASPVPRGKIVLEKTTLHKSGLVLGIREVRSGDNKSREVSLRDADGELVSVAIGKKGGFDWPTLRFMGERPSTLWLLSPAQRQRQHMRLHRVSVEALRAVMKNSGMKDHKFDIRFRGLGGMIRALQIFTASAMQRALYSTAYDPFEGNHGLVPGQIPGDIGPTVPGATGHPPSGGNSGLNDECTEANGCGPDSAGLEKLVPELQFHECCNKHDICYCRGCNSCDRADCDDEFLTCMLAAAPAASPAAIIYYLFVRAFGFIAFNYCGGDLGVGGLVAAVGGVAAGILAGLPLAAILGPGMAVAVGIAVAGVATWLISRILCEACELVTDTVEGWEETVGEEERRLREEIKKRSKKCRKKKWWGWLKCVVKLIVTIIKWIVVVVTHVIVEAVLKVVQFLLC